MTAPLDIRQVGDAELLITWEDGHRSLYENRYLRLNCPCAACLDEWSGKRILKPENLPEKVKPIETRPVGHYAIRFLWNDGHQTGIYGYDYLKKICPCRECSSKK